MARLRATITVPALRVHQWSPDWNEVSFDPQARRERPSDHFYLFTLPVGQLRRLAGIWRRSARELSRRESDLGIQRQHDQRRSDKIGEFVRYGYPWSDLRDLQRKDPEFASLRKPGWLPTAIVVNILRPSDSLNDEHVNPEDLVRVLDERDNTRLAQVELPAAVTRRSWKPSVPPLEVIDGQHRLWAFGFDSESDFELPVVAFVGLDRSWQAYLFWTINITPRRINPSLAFDLYPLLRAEDWLEKFEGHRVYRQTRAQEITEVLWSHPQSPWRGRVNMLGERGLGPGVTQAAWINALTASFIKSWEGRGVSIGGLFGTAVGREEHVLPWTRTQQAAFILYAWMRLADAVHGTSAKWAGALRRIGGTEGDDAFIGRYSLLATDQGVRAYLAAINDMCWVRADSLRLGAWYVDLADEPDDPVSATLIDRALVSLAKRRSITSFLTNVARRLATFDWRTSSTPGLTRPEQLRKAAFRGSGGYRQLRLELNDHLAGAPGAVGEAAREVRRLMR